VTGVPFGPYSATVVSIHDGDTLSVDVVLVHDRHHRHDPDRDLGFNVHEVSGVGVVLERQAVRLVGCDDYLERTQDLAGPRYVEVEAWAWRLLRERLRALAARHERLHAA
jgi:hypothetical protein